MDGGGPGQRSRCSRNSPTCMERGRRDGVDRLYVECRNRGELIQAGARVTDVGALLREVLERWGAPAAIVCDRWREAELRQSLEAVDFPACQLIVRGQGFLQGRGGRRERISAGLHRRQGGTAAQLVTPIGHERGAGANRPGGKQQAGKGRPGTAHALPRRRGCGCDSSGR